MDEYVKLSLKWKPRTVPLPFPVHLGYWSGTGSRVRVPVTGKGVSEAGKSSDGEQASRTHEMSTALNDQEARAAYPRGSGVERIAS